MKALFVTELGGGYGNVAPLVDLASELEQLGVRPIFALADGVTPATLFANRAWPRLAAPALREPLRPRPGPASYGDILASCGFGDAETLAALAAQWDSLFSVVAPDFIVASHAPSAVLAARGRFPVAVIGTGFTVPPSHTATFPALRPDTMSFRPETVALETANAVLRARGAAPLATLPALLAVDARIVTSVAELDPYAALRKDSYAQIGASEGATIPQSASGVFAFLDVRGPEAAHAVESLAIAALTVPVEAHLRGPGARSALAFLARRGVRTHAAPIPMREALSRAKTIVSQGGHGTCLAALKAARTSVVLPAHFEAMLNGVALERAGVGKVAWGGSTDTIAEHVSWALSAPAEIAQTASAQMIAPARLDPSALLDRMLARPALRAIA